MELRFYCFVNYYLSSIQQGIQTGHAAVDVVRKYTRGAQDFANKVTTYRTSLVEDWADNHKTFVTLNGGNSAGIKAATAICDASGFPYSVFNEDDASLDGIQTCVGIVLPESVFAARIQRPDNFSTIPYYRYVGANESYRHTFPGDEHYDLINLVTSAGLAK